MRWLIALTALAVAVLAPSTAGAAMSKPTNYYFVAGGTAKVSGMAVSGYTGKSVLVSLSTSVGTLKITSTTTGVTPSFGYTLEGKELLFTGTQKQVNAALAFLAVTTPPPAKKVTKPGVATTPVVISGMAAENKPGVAYYPPTQHFHEFVEGVVPWAKVEACAGVVVCTPSKGANELAQAKTQFGQAGYLAAISSAEENAFVASKLEGADGTAAKNVWIGASDKGAEGTWTWRGGPENEVQFWQGAQTGAAVDGRYSSWATDEPNNCKWNGTGCDVVLTNSEDCAVINKLNKRPSASDLAAFTPGRWNDLPCDFGKLSDANISGYIVEYGNKATGGDFADIDLISKSITRYLPVTGPPPNVRQGIFKTKSVSKKAKELPRKQGLPASFKVDLRLQMNVAGTYNVYVKRPDGKGIPFAFQPGSKVAVGKGLFPKTTKLNKPEWTVQVKTAKDNETDRKSTRLNSSHVALSRMPSSA